MLKTLNILIPARDNSPATTLYVKITAQDELSLQTKPYIFVLPGGPGFNHSNYKDYACLQTVGNVVFHDPRGCGLSDKGDPATYTMDNYIQDVEIIRQILQFPKIVLVGKSYGAMCALGYTLHYPEVVSKLVVAAGAPSYKFLETAKINLLTRYPTEQQNKLCEKLWSGTFSSNEEFARYASEMRPFYSYKIRHGEPTHRPVHDYPIAFEPANQGFAGFMRSFDFESQLHEIKCPTLILVGEEDWITDKKHSQVIADGIAESKLIIFPKADHSMEGDVPELYFKAIKDFVRLELKNNMNPRLFQPSGEEELDETTKAFVSNSYSRR